MMPRRYLKPRSYLKLKSCVLAASLICLVSLPVLAQTTLPKTGLAGTTHDIAAVGCKGCHAPHNGSTSNGGSATTGGLLLWARSFPNANNTFGVYDSSTLANKPAEIGGSLTTSADVRMYSMLCLSCHDGVTSSFSTAMKAENQVGAKTSFGTGAADSMGLANDHPVNLSYDPTKNTTLQPVTTVAASLPLYGTNNTVQCSTCHEPHNNTNTNYLRQPNSTTHCTTCHK